MSKKLWVVTLTQTEPLLAATEEEALEIANGDVGWKLNRVFPEGFCEAMPMPDPIPEEDANAIPWGEEEDRTCAEIRAAETSYAIEEKS